MTGARIIEVMLDEAIPPSRTDALERERTMAMADMVANNRFEPSRALSRGQNGPYRVRLRCVEGRLVIDIASVDREPIETIVIGLARLRRPIKDYLAMLNSHLNALAGLTHHHVETLDMARRALHNDGADLLRDCLHGKVTMDFETARRLFTLVAVLHLRD